MIKNFLGLFTLGSSECMCLPREEGGQGLTHLASRTATLQLQFKQRHLTGPKNYVWREVAIFIFRRVNKLSLDVSLFLTDPMTLRLNALPLLYQAIFKSWTLFKYIKTIPTNSL